MRCTSTTIRPAVRPAICTTSGRDCGCYLRNTGPLKSRLRQDEGRELNRNNNCQSTD
jgi:hypothetical protein